MWSRGDKKKAKSAETKLRNAGKYDGYINAKKRQNQKREHGRGGMRRIEQGVGQAGGFVITVLTFAGKGFVFVYERI
jgi:hypothetical protein